MDFLRKIAAFGLRFDDAVNVSFQRLANYGGLRGYQLSAIGRDACCMALSGLATLSAATVVADIPVAEKLLVGILLIVVASRETKLLAVHDRNCKLGWREEVIELYRQTAARHRITFLPFRLAGVVALITIPAYTVATDTPWEFNDLAGYLTFVIFIAKYHFERCLPFEGNRKRKTPRSKLSLVGEAF